MIEQITTSKGDYLIKYDPSKYSKQALVKKIELSDAEKMNGASVEYGSYSFERIV